LLARKGKLVVIRERKGSTVLQRKDMGLLHRPVKKGVFAAGRDGQGRSFCAFASGKRKRTRAYLLLQKNSWDGGRKTRREKKKKKKAKENKKKKKKKKKKPTKKHPQTQTIS